MSGWIWGAMWLLACADPPVPAPPPERATLDLRATTVPMAWLAERIAGDAATVTLALPPEADAATWQPTGDQVAALAQADLVVANGAGLEGWLATSALPETRVVQTASTLDLRELPGETHSHGAEGAHSHGRIDPHTWLDPLGFAVQGEVLAAALERLRPDDPAPTAHAAALRIELEALGQALVSVAAPLRGVPLASNHPSYGYLARRAQLEILAFDLDPDSPPTDTAFLAWAAAHPDGVVLWERAPASGVTAALPGLKHVVLDPLESPGADGSYDYLDRFRDDLTVLQGLAPQ